jgi:adenine deaminase
VKTQIFSFNLKQFLGLFAQSRKAHIIFVRPVRPSTRLSVCIDIRPSVRLSVSTDQHRSKWKDFRGNKKSVKKTKFLKNRVKIEGTSL